MDIDGLGELIVQTREDMLRQFKDMKEHCQLVTDGCSKRLKSIEKKADEHETSITRIKSLGIFIAFVWTAIVAFVTKHWGS